MPQVIPGLQVFRERSEHFQVGTYWLAPPWGVEKGVLFNFLPHHILIIKVHSKYFM